MEDEHSGEFFEERQKMLERAAEEAKPKEVLIGEIVSRETQPADSQFTTREQVLDFIRKNSV